MASQTMYRLWQSSQGEHTEYTAQGCSPMISLWGVVSGFQDLPFAVAPMCLEVFGHKSARVATLQHRSGILEQYFRRFEAFGQGGPKWSATSSTIEGNVQEESIGYTFCDSQPST